MSTSTRIPGKRGRKAPSHLPQLALSRFKSNPFPPAPPSGDVTNNITDFGMLGNDTYGDCGPAATEHYRMTKSGVNTLNINGAEQPADSQATTTYTEQLYFAYGQAQGEPGPNPDEGVTNAIWLKWLYDKGLIEGFAELDVTNPNEIHQAMNEFHGVLVGCSLTDNAENEFAEDQPWTITPQEQPDPNMGHDILLVKYDQNGETFVTWGALQNATVAWEQGEVLAGDLEAWVIITSEDAARTGVDMTALRSAIESLGGEEIPTPEPTPEPVPPAPQPNPPPTLLQELLLILKRIEQQLKNLL